MGPDDRDDRAATETDRERCLRRAAEARAFVARVAPELLDEAGVDTTLHELTLARGVLERLDDAFRQCLEEEWLRGLKRVDASSRH